MSDVPLSTRSGWPRALWGGFLSLILPGLGQVYAGWWRLGIFLFVGMTALELSLIALTWLSPTAGIVAASFGVASIVLILRAVIAIDAIRRVRSRWVKTPIPWYRSTWLAAIAMITISFGPQLSGVFQYSPGWRTFHIASASNMPTLLTSDYVVADVRHSEMVPAYGDVIAFRHPRDPKTDYVKRVVGLPGDRVQLRGGILYLNGKPVPREPQGLTASFGSTPLAANLKQYRETLPNGRTYMILETPSSASENSDEFNVPAGSLFVLGDNRGNSLDSRFLRDVGYVPISNVIGTVRTVFWTSQWATEPGRLLSRVQ